VAPIRLSAIRAAVSFKGLFAISVWGASFVATQFALEALTPFGIVAARLVAGTLLLALVVKARRGRLVPLRGDLGVCTFLGLVIAAHLLIQARGLQYTSAINTGWIVGFMPVTIALGAALLRQQRLRALGWLGVAVGTAGVIAVTLKEPPNFAQAHWGDLLQMCSCLTWTVYTLAAVAPIARNGTLTVTTFSMGVAALITLSATLATGPVHAALTWRTWLALGFLGPICSGVGYYAWLAAQREHGPTRIGALLYLEPFVTVAVAMALRSEPLTPNAILGGLLVLVGVWLVARGSHRPPKPGFVGPVTDGA
jgi:drug/metabolite transporter (DMT)-like permease